MVEDLRAPAMSSLQRLELDDCSLPSDTAAQLLRSPRQAISQQMRGNPAHALELQQVQ
jgi:hypothetical protein